MNVGTEELIALQTRSERIRNICILAHVDHGKTTLSDHLIGSNGLIHPKLMGELRYMDSRDDEQARGITMKSSSIALLYVPGAAQLPGGPNACSAKEKQEKGILVNLIDSPGHVDFCSEVSSAARLSDGALVVIDVVEGVCIQTHAVLRQAWEEKVKLTLVLNKMDRLVLELQLTPEQAYERMKAIITQVNMILSSFESERFISEADAVLAVQEASAQAASREGAAENEEEEEEEEDLEFSPEKGNVVFASAHDGWAFSTSQFAGMYAAKMGIKREKLAAILWGDWAYDAKSKRVLRIKRSQAHKQKPLFVQLALAPVWRAYEAAAPGADSQSLLLKIVKGLGLTQPTEKSLNSLEPRKALRQVLQAWLPLSEAVLGMAATHLPSPVTAAKERVKRLLPSQLPDAAALSADLKKSVDAVHAAVASCSTSDGAPTVVYVSKMVAVPAAALPRNSGEPAVAARSEDVFLAFGRVFSGQLRDGQKVHVLSAAYKPSELTAHRQEATVTGLYMMMGRGLERLSSAPAGNVIAIGGLEANILKSATLASTPAANPIAPMMFQASPIVRVAVEPADPTQMPQLVDGLRLLNRADPFVEVVVQESGEHVIGAAGEVHLEMCIKDLRERFARVDLQVSAPLVAFRESVLCPAEASEAAPKPAKVVEGRTANGRCILRVRAHALPRAIAAVLMENEALLRRAVETRPHDAERPLEYPPNGATGLDAESRQDSESALESLRSRLREALEGDQTGLLQLLQKAWLLGPHYAGPNLLLSSEGDRTRGGLFSVPDSMVTMLSKRAGAADLAAPSVFEPDDGQLQEATDDIPLGRAAAAELLGFSQPSEGSLRASGGSGGGYLQTSVESGITAGFQLASANGPLCDEPMWGIAFEVEAQLQVPEEESGPSTTGRLAEEVYGPMSGQVTAVARQAFRRAILEAGPRLVEAMFLCEVSTTAEALSGTYAVLGQRRGRVLREELREGSDLFSIHAYLPAEASFGFSDDMRRRSSGAASASLMLSHWERLQVDPFFTPTTEEEREEFGEEGQGVGAPNLANQLIDKVRRRKGLPVDKKVVESSTKQRTRARKV